MDNINIMTIDLEDYFQVSAFESVLPRGDWPNMPSRIEFNCHKILTIFELNKVKGTFFVLGWIAKKYPGLIREIAEQGHEIACHGYWHQRVTDLERKEFSKDIFLSKQLLEDITGQSVLGYRAPSFSFNATNTWVYDELKSAGYKYSSSIYPIRHDHYGSPNLPRFSFECRPGFYEVPISTLKLFGNKFPIGGGGYFRLFPFWLSLWALRKFHRVEKQAYIFYMHPWELDPGQPRIPGVKWKNRFRHYLNLQKTHPRLEQLCRSYRWQRMDSLFLYHAIGKTENHEFTIAS